MHRETGKEREENRQLMVLNGQCWQHTELASEFEARPAMTGYGLVSHNPHAFLYSRIEAQAKL